MISIGEKLAGEFRRERLHSTEKIFHAAITRNNFSSFSKSKKTCTVTSKDGKTKVVEVNRGILSSLNSYCLRSATAIDLQKVLKYPLCPVRQMALVAVPLRAS